MELFKEIYKLLPPNLQKGFWYLLIAMIGLAFVETGAVGIIAFYAAMISDPQSAYQSLLSFHIFGFSSPEIISQLTIKSVIGVFSLLLIAAVLIKNTYSGIITLNIAKYSATVESLFGSCLLESFLFRPYLWHLNKNSADLVQYVNWRVYLGRHLLTPVLRALTEICMLVVLLVGLLLVQPLVSLLFILVQVCAGFVVYRYLRKGLDVNARGCREAERSLSRDATMALHAIKDVQITGSQQHFLGQFKVTAEMFSDLFGKQQFWRESPLLALESIGFILISLTILFMLFVLGFSPLETTATTALLAVTAWRTLPAFNRVVSALATIRSSTPYAEQLISEMGLIEYRGQQYHNAEKLTALKFDQSIEFKNIDFSYSDENKVLDNFSLTIQKGASVGIMGPSGCGKSTFVDLLTGLLTPQRGVVLVDGIGLSENLIPQWKKRIGYVSQFPYIVDGTIADNVSFGVSSIEMDRCLVRKSLKLAGVDFLDQLSAGMDTFVGERGIKLSGGQRQRIAIARALYQKPEVLILDEPTSALDDDSCAKIKQLVVSLENKITIILISHNEKLIESCALKLRM